MQAGPQILNPNPSNYHALQPNKDIKNPIPHFPFPPTKPLFRKRETWCSGSTVFCNFNQIISVGCAWIFIIWFLKVPLRMLYYSIIPLHFFIWLTTQVFMVFKIYLTLWLASTYGYVVVNSWQPALVSVLFASSVLICNAQKWEIYTVINCFVLVMWLLFKFLYVDQRTFFRQVGRRKIQYSGRRSGSFRQTPEEMKCTRFPSNLSLGISC